MFQLIAAKKTWNLSAPVCPATPFLSLQAILWVLTPFVLSWTMVFILSQLARKVLLVGTFIPNCLSYLDPRGKHKGCIMAESGPLGWNKEE